MSNSDLSPLEAFHNTFFYFVEGVHALASDATRQRQVVGGSHVAWELQNDLCDHGEAVLRCAGSFLAASERAGIDLLLDKVRALSPDALRSSADALENPQWEGMRREAQNLLITLASPIAKNRAFFNQS